MSQYLTIYKNDIPIIDFSRSSLVYQYFDLPYTEDLKELTKDEIRDTLQNAEDSCNEIKEIIKEQKTLFKNLTNIDDMREVLQTIRECKEEQVNRQNSKSFVYMINLIFEQCFGEEKLYYKVC